MYLRGLWKVTLHLYFPSFCFLYVPPLALSSSDVVNWQVFHSSFFKRSRREEESWKIFPQMCGHICIHFINLPLQLNSSTPRALKLYGCHFKSLLCLPGPRRQRGVHEARKDGTKSIGMSVSLTCRQLLDCQLQKHFLNLLHSQVLLYIDDF